MLLCNVSQELCGVFYELCFVRTKVCYQLLRLLRDFVPNRPQLVAHGLVKGAADAIFDCQVSKITRVRGALESQQQEQHTTIATE